MNRMKTFALTLFLGLGLCLTGCAGKGQDTLTITLVAADTMMPALKERFPDIHFEVEYYKGRNSSGYLVEHMQHPDAMPDLFIGTYLPEPELQKQSLLDLSGYDFVNRYQTAFVNNSSIDGEVYLLPCNYQMQSYVYNKTLFEEHGWKEPTNHAELVALVKQIRNEAPELIPISFPGNLSGYPFLYFGYFSQCDFLRTPQGAEWQKQFMKGEASAEEGFGEGAFLFQELVDAGAFDSSLTETTNVSCLEKFVNREAAMSIVFADYSVLNEAMETGSDEYGAFPFLGKTETNRLVSVPIARYVGLGKHLGEKGNEKKLENALKVMDFFSTTEGLQLLSTSYENLLLPLKDMETEALHPLYQDLYYDVEAGYVATPMYGGYTDIINTSGLALQDVLLGKSTVTEAMQVMDETKANALAQGGSVYVGEVAERMSNAEAAQFGANLYLDTGLGQIALVSNGDTTYHGNIRNPEGVCGIMFEGKISEDQSYINIPHNHKFVTLKLNGQQIKTMLEDGKLLINDKNESESEIFKYFWAGMDVTMEKGKVTSMKLDGQDMDMNQIYEVVMAQGDYSQEVADAAEITVHEDFPDTTTFFVQWLSKENHYIIEKPEVLRK